MTITAHIDPGKNTIDGVTFDCTHRGQKRAYGDSYYEYMVESDLPTEEVERVCSEKVYKAISEDMYRAEYKAAPTADNHFRSSYKFKSIGGGKYLYVVTFPYTD